MNRTIAAWALSATTLLAGTTLVHASMLYNSRGSIELRHDAVRIFARGAPHADIRRNGELLIGGNAVALTPAERVLTLHYYADAHAVAASGEAVGKTGGWLALKVIGSLFSALWHDNSAIVNHTAHSQHARLETRLQALCSQLNNLWVVQERLAAAQPAFSPYTYLSKSDVEECFKSVNDSDN